MSATARELAYPRRRVLARMDRLRRAADTLPARAFVASRLIVLGAGVAGALSGARQDNWEAFDPTRLSGRLGAVGNLLGASAIRWDSIHYLSIAAQGYRSRGSTVFFPLYPLLIRGLTYIVGSEPLAGVMISLAALLGTLVLLHRLARLELGSRAAGAAVLLVAFAPMSFFFSAVYTESLFLVLSVGAVYAARRDRPALAGCLGGLAAATRVTGVLLVIPLGIMQLQRIRRLDRRLTWTLLVPAGLAGYLGFVAARGFGLLAPFAQEAAAQYQRSMSGPLATLVSAGRAALAGVASVGTSPVYHPSLGGPFSPGGESVLLLAVLLVALLALVAAFRRLPLAYGAYALAALLVCISNPVPAQPLRSIDRYALTIFPLWMAAGAWLSERRLTRVAVVASASLLAFFTFQFATWAFIA